MAAQDGQVLTPETLVRMIRSGSGAYMELKRGLSGIDAAVACSEVTGSPHTIASILGHMNYWQEWMLAKIGGGSPALPEHAAGGWPAVPSSRRRA